VDLSRFSGLAFQNKYLPVFQGLYQIVYLIFGLNVLCKIFIYDKGFLDNPLGEITISSDISITVASL
jgi:hypothetical protein